MPNAILAITDGTKRISLITKPWQLEDWTAQTARLKDGGIRRGSPLSDGTRLVDYSYANVIDTFTLKAMHGEQDGTIRTLQEMRRLLEKGRRYWTDEWATEPVWIEARGPEETNTRYATIKDWLLPADDNPYAQPFFPQQEEAVMDDLVLTLEHDFWQADEPGTATATEISAQQDYCLETIFEPAASGDDADTDSGGGGTISLVATTLSFGVDAAGDDLDAGIRFIGVSPPQGATICYAYIEGVCGVATAGTPCDTRIYGEDNSTPALFTTYADFHARTRTTAFVDWNGIPAWILGTVYQTPDIATIVQEIVDRADWAPTNDMVIFIEEHGSATPAFRQMASWDNVVYDAPKLIIYWMGGSASLRGQAATDVRKAFVVNKHNEANITHVFTWTSPGGPFGANLIGAALPFDLFTGGAAGPANGDQTYFGINTAVPNSGPFNNLVFDILTAATYGAGDTADWEYWNGAWVALTVFDATSVGSCTQDEPFEETGTNNVVWDQPDDWAAVAVNGITAYWVRLIVTEATGITRAQQHDQDIYSTVWNSVLIDDLQVGGDLPALTQITIDAKSECETTAPWFIGGTVSRVMVGLKTVSRGAAFRAFTNLADTQNETGVSVSAFGPNSAFAGASGALREAPTGRYVAYTPAAAAVMQREMRLQFGGVSGSSYRGQYHAFVRYRYNTAVGAPSDGDIRARLALKYDPNAQPFITDTVDLAVSTGNWLAADFGRIRIPAGSAITVADVPQYYVEIHLQNIPAAARELWLYDLVLMPVDEWFGNFEENVTPSSTSARPLLDRDALDINSVRYPKLKIVGYNRSIDFLLPVNEEWIPYSAGSAILQANTEQHLWFFFMRNGGALGVDIPHQADPHLMAKISVSHTARYQSMRGAR